MPTLQKYKREHADQLPSEGEGRRQRYPMKALKVFERLKSEALERRGRKVGKKKRSGGKAAGVARKRAKKSAASDKRKEGKELVTLAEIERRTGISYPTLLRYARLHGKRIPHEGRGRRRRYSPQAVEVFQELRAASRRGRRKGSAATAVRSSTVGLGDSLRRLERAQRALQRQVASLEKRLSRPIQVTLRR